ncbi:MAG: addiction module protein [Pirellulaceae bacterium]
MSVDINELKNLPTSEKLRLVELLWDDISASNEPIVLHSWQFSEATRRGSDFEPIQQLPLIATNCGAASMADPLRFHWWPRTFGLPVNGMTRYLPISAIVFDGPWMDVFTMSSCARNHSDGWRESFVPFASRDFRISLFIAAGHEPAKSSEYSTPPQIRRNGDSVHGDTVRILCFRPNVTRSW